MEQLKLGIGSDPECLFEALTGQAFLRLAFKKVKANRGKPGPDGQTISDFDADWEANLATLRDELIDWSYKPGPVRRVMLPKPNGGQRPLGIPNVRDRIVQQALAMLLSPLFEPRFSDHSHGFREGRSQRSAIEEGAAYVKEGKQWVVDLDLARFFDTVNRDRMINLLRSQVSDKRIIRLVGDVQRCGVLVDGKVVKTRVGLTQGSPLSPLLSNIVLHELDEELERRNLSFVRYADDTNIYVGSEKAAERVLESVTRFIEKKLKLEVNRSKSKTGLSSAVKFLGMVILICGSVAISNQAMSKAYAKLKELIPRGGQSNLSTQINEVNTWYRGWSSYFAVGEYPGQLKNIEARMRTRFRVQFIKNHKRKKHLLRKLVQLGAKRSGAYDQLYKRNHGRWKLAHVYCVYSTWSTTWFDEKRMYRASGQDHPNWKDLKAYPKIL